MTCTDFRPITARPGLDVTPMISALQFQPTDFELSHGWLKHVPSHHRFKFDDKGRVTIEAHCNCSSRPVTRDHSDQLFQAFASWRQYYWEPLRIDREFASHFRTPNAWLRLFRDIRMAWRRFRGQTDPITLPATATTFVAAEQPNG